MSAAEQFEQLTFEPQSESLVVPFDRKAFSESIVPPQNPYGDYDRRAQERAVNSDNQWQTERAEQPVPRHPRRRKVEPITGKFSQPVPYSELPSGESLIKQKAVYDTGILACRVALFKSKNKPTEQ